VVGCVRQALQGHCELFYTYLTYARSQSNRVPCTGQDSQGTSRVLSNNMLRERLLVLSMGSLRMRRRKTTLPTLNCHSLRTSNAVGVYSKARLHQLPWSSRGASRLQ